MKKTVNVDSARWIEVSRTESIIRGNSKRKCRANSLENWTRHTGENPVTTLIIAGKVKNDKKDEKGNSSEGIGNNRDTFIHGIGSDRRRTETVAGVTGRAWTV